MIETLKQKVEQFEKEKLAISQETQTQSDLDSKCNECNFEGKSKQDLVWHMSENHGWPKEKESVDLDSSQGVMYCSICHYKAEDMFDLDAHS